MKIPVTNYVHAKMSFLLIIIVLILLMVSNGLSQMGPDPNFYIFLCFGQSNMEGQGTIEQQDKTVDSRFQVMEAVDCSNLGRTKDSWYTAVPPTCRCYTGLSPVDYFGRTMVANLPDNIRVGVINVSVAGCKIELFDKDKYQAYASTVEDWMKNIINEYGGNPYARLVDLAKLAQNDGVIKGILLHQGESNTGDSQWPSKVKKIYDNLMNDLSLDSGSVPLLAGEVVSADQGGVCASMNSIIAKLPQILPNSYVISSSGCTAASDHLHFNSAGYRELGKRYAVKMLSLLGYEMSEGSSEKWVGTWSTAPQLVEMQNNPPSPGLSNNTLRQIVHVSIGGDSLRMRFTNEFSTSSVTMHSVHIAVSTGSGSIDTTTDKTMYFNGSPEVTMSPGTAVTSDPFQFLLQPLSDVAITIYFGDTSPDVTGHPGSRTTSYILTGNEVTKADFSGAVTTDHWYIINTIDVKASDSTYAVAILGNSITDGRGSGTNKQNRWPDELARRLQANPATQHVAVLNEGIGGNCVLAGGLGPFALSRFERDVLNQNGVKWLIILEGINDIGNAWGTGVANNLINAYTQMIQNAHANGVFVYGATLLPMKGSSYYSTSHETERQTVNNWIRNSGYFDAVIDFDMALRNAADTLCLCLEADTGDHLHPNEAGHRMMAEAVDLNLFVGKDSLIIPTINYRSIYFEPECAIVGDSWEILTDPLASNGKYVTAKPGIQSLSAAPTDGASAIYIPFSVDTTANFNLYIRANCPTYDDDSFWAKMDSEQFVMYNGLVTNGWEWVKLSSFDLTAGEHKLTITYREDGARLDKICISNNITPPSGMGEDAENLCDTTTTGINSIKKIREGYELGQNYPNPFNPVTIIKYSIPRHSFITLKVFDLLGNEVATLVKGMKQAGDYAVSFSGKGLASGVYVYQLKANGFIATKKFELLK